jgi:hypothetical protein
MQANPSCERPCKKQSVACPWSERFEAFEIFEHQVDMRTHREDMSHIVASTIVLHDLEHICLTYDRVLPKRSEMKSDCYPCICI